MRVNRRKNNSRARQTVYDLITLLCGLSVIALGIFTFIDPKKRAWLLPVIFADAALFQVISAIPGLGAGPGPENKGKKLGALMLLGFAILLMALAVISAVCVWR